jgi:hypothetical protein
VPTDSRAAAAVRIARFLVTPELLREMFRLPVGTAIVWAGMDHHTCPSTIEITIEHQDLRDVELVEDELPPLIRPTYRCEGDIIMLVDWGQG